MGYFFRKPSIDYYDLYYRGAGIKEFDNRWKQAGDELKTSVPSMLYPYNRRRKKFYQYAEVNALPGDYVKLQDIRLSYAPFSATHSLLKSFQVYAMFSNLNLILWKANKQGVDPDYPSGNINGAITSLGIKANF